MIDRLGLSLKRATYTWMVERNGVTVLREFDIFGTEHYLREIPPAPYRFHALAAERGGPCVFIDLDAGDELIWEHRVRDGINIFSGGRVIEDCAIVGRRTSALAENVMLIYPDGALYEFTSLNEARAHTR